MIRFSLMVPPARLERATYCSASKRSNPLSYEGLYSGWYFNAESKQGQGNAFYSRTWEAANF